MKPLVKWIRDFFGVHITNTIASRPTHRELMTPAQRAEHDGMPRRRRARRFVDRNSLRQLEVGKGIALEPKRALQCRYGNCPNLGAYTLIAITPAMRLTIEMTGASNTAPPPRILCEAHGEMLHELFTKSASDETSPMFGAEVKFEPIAEAA